MEYDRNHPWFRNQPPVLRKWGETYFREKEWKEEEFEETWKDKIKEDVNIYNIFKK